MLEDAVVWLGPGRAEEDPLAELRARLVLRGIDPKVVQLRTWRVQATSLRPGHPPRGERALRATVVGVSDGLTFVAPWEGRATEGDRLFVEVLLHHRRVAWAVTPLQERRRREERPQPGN